MAGKELAENNYQIKCVMDCIVSLEAKGKDASFERDLLKSWAKYPRWEQAGDGIQVSTKVVQ